METLLAPHPHSLVVAAADIDETAHSAGRAAIDAVRAVASAKFAAAQRALTTEVPDPGRHRRRRGAAAVKVIAADTLVVGPDGRAVGKPADHADATRMIRLFSDATIRVITSVATGVVVPSREASPRAAGAPMLAEPQIDVASTDLALTRIPDADITAYLATDVPWDKAGALELQGASAGYVRSVNGCWTNVVGLPACIVAARLGLPGAAEPHRSPEGVLRCDCRRELETDRGAAYG